MTWLWHTCLTLGIASSTQPFRRRVAEAFTVISTRSVCPLLPRAPASMVSLLWRSTLSCVFASPSSGSTDRTSGIGASNPMPVPPVVVALERWRMRPTSCFDARLIRHCVIGTPSFLAPAPPCSPCSGHPTWTCRGNYHGSFAMLSGPARSCSMLDRFTTGPFDFYF